MKLLVTGGAGYIGSVVTAQLLDAGHEVSVLDNLSTGHRDAVPPGATFIGGDITEAAAALDGADAVLHFAAKSLVGESVAHPERYWRANLVATLALLDAMRDAGVRRLVFSSTAATYGAPDVSPITEDVLTAPMNPYGQTKLAIEYALAGEAAAHGLAAVSLRYFNVGGSYRGFGERHDPETHLIPNVLAVAKGVREAVDVFGADYPTRDGTAVRDYLHVEDLGRAHLLALEAIERRPTERGTSGGPSATRQIERRPTERGATSRHSGPSTALAGVHQVFNLGTGTGCTVREVIDACRRVTSHPIPSVDRDRRAGDPPSLVTSAARAADTLGWQPEHGLDRIVADAWAVMSV